MGNQKQKWTADEEEALLNGVTKHGPGKWKNILKDPEFAPFLTHRSNIDLKDKWRNLSVSTSAQGSRSDKSRLPKVKAIVASLPNATNSAPAAARAQTVTTDTAVADPSNSNLDGKNGPRYNAMIFEALSAIKDTNGSDVPSIFSYIAQRHEVAENFRRLLSSRLRRLVSQGKLEKVANNYRIRKDTVVGTKTPSPKAKDNKLRQNSGTLSSSETVEDAASTAAYKVADAENKSFLAAEAVKESERVSKMAEDTESMLEFVKEIYEQCSRGEFFVLGCN
ncbi:hypothetical protein CCACVL1_01127 [Corchorus capsularis]|uniref:MYB transcription factor n=1 Tax=Corchorus capsularis TaxID=210143 RepID=A0A1R3KMJ8_COCAP|nr:hypothetical protein CCACVL1_01127 [Corchorus capsularis]